MNQVQEAEQSVAPQFIQLVAAMSEMELESAACWVACSCNVRG